MSRAVDVPGDALVIRFSPTRPERVLRNATVEMVRTGDHSGASCFADTPHAGETEEQLLVRLLQVAELSHINLASNKVFFVCARAAEVTALGFRFVKDEDDDELPEHYCVDLGVQPTIDDADRFLAVFRRRNVTEVYP